MAGLPTLPRRVRWFLAGQAISAIGSWASLVAIWGYAAYAFDADPGDIGLVGLAWLLPPVVLGPLAGVVIDRAGPRSVLIGAKVVGAVASIGLVFAGDFGVLVVWSIGHGVSYAFYQPALDAFPARLVDDDALAGANALLRVATDLAIVLGPVAAAGSIALVGFDGAFVFDALTYLIGIAATLIVHLRPAPVTAEAALTAEPAGAWHQTWEGLRLVAGRPALRSTVFLTGCVYFLYGAALLLEPIYVRDVLERPVSTFAFLQTAFGVCLVASGLLVARLGDRAATRAALVAGVVGSGIGAVWYLGTPWLVAAYAGVMFWGAVTAFVSGPSRTLLQRNAPVEQHGRVFAVDRTIEGIAHLAAMPVAAGLAAWLGVPGAAAVIAAIVVAGGLVALVPATARAPAVAPRPADDTLAPALAETVPAPSEAR